MQFIDLSLALENDRQFAPWWARTRVRYQSHRFGRWAIHWIWGLPRHLLGSRTGWANETLHLSSHGTTHVDAPWHYGPKCEGGPARTIDQMPLDWFYGPGVVIDIRHLAKTEAATVETIQSALRQEQLTLEGGEIVLFRTGNDQLWRTRDYFTAGPGVSATATRWLIDRGVRLMGIDAWGFDAPLDHQVREAKRTGRKDLFWESHFVGTEREYCHIERLANLDALPSGGFHVCAFPLKVAGGSAGPARVVAMIDRPQEESGTARS